MNRYAREYKEHLESTERKILDELEKMVRAWEASPERTYQDATVYDLYHGYINNESVTDLAEDLNGFIAKWRGELLSC